MSDENSQAVSHRPTIGERFWRAMGFRYHWVDLDDDPNLPGWMITQSWMQFSLADRLRLLITGRLYIDLRQATNVQVDTAKSALSFRIGRPGERQ